MEALADGQRQLELAKFPLWYGSRDRDTYTAEQWIERINSTRTDGNWNDQRTMTHVLASLRGKALIWWESLRRCGIDRSNWEAFRRAFITTYSEARTARSIQLSISDLSQRSNEAVNDYHPRLVSILDDVEHFWPAQFNQPAAVNVPATIAALPGWDAVPAADKMLYHQQYLRDGAQQGLNSMGLLLFKAGLQPRLRDELMKSAPGQLWEAFEEAQTLERVWNLNSKKQTVASLEEDQAAHDIASMNGEELLAHLDALKRSFSKKPQGKPNGAQGGRNPKWKDMECHYCHKKGHPQKECFKRKRENGAMVDWRKIRAVEEDDDEGPHLGASSVGAVQATGVDPETAFEKIFGRGKAALN